MVSLVTLLFFRAPFPVAPIVTLFTSGILFSIFSWFLFKYFSLNTAIYTIIVFDALTITGLVFFSGGIESPFYFLYIFPIIVAASFLSKGKTLYIATFVFIVFGVLADLMYLDIIPPPPDAVSPDVSFVVFIYNLLMGFLAFFVVALVSSHYFDKIRRADEELRNAQENLKDLILLNNTVLEKMESGLITCAGGGQIISQNVKSKQLLSMESDGNLFEKLLDKKQRAEIRALNRDRNELYFEKSVRGRQLAFSVSLLEKIYAYDKLFVFIIMDLTDRKRIEKQLKEREHLALIGQMAAGIAHEIRNPLASISGSVQFLKKELSLGKEYRNLMDIIVKESNRLSMSIDEFLNFSKNTPLKKSSFNLAALLDEILEILMVKNSYIRFVKKYGKAAAVIADRNKVEQLIWNLMNNAIKAVDRDGRVEVTIFNKKTGPCLSIKDNGVGMTKEDLQKVFIPFHSKFTSGIGLGMPIVKQIADDHQFEMSIQSQKGIGTEVSICLTKS